MLTNEEVIALVAEAFNVEPETLTPETHQDEVEEWDSMGVLLLMAELDERFDLVLEEEVLERLNTIQDIIDILAEQGAAGA